MNKKSQKPRTEKPNALTNDQQIKQLWEAIEDLVKDDERLHTKLHTLSVDSREHDERLQVVERVESEEQDDHENKCLQRLDASDKAVTIFVLCALTGLLFFDLGRLAGWW